MNEKQNDANATTLAVAQPSSTGINILDPQQFDLMQRASAMFATSALVPPMYQVGGEATKGKPITRDQAIANCMIALDVASRTGASPLMVMQNLVIVYNRPSWSSSFLIATVNACGRFNPLKFKLTNKGRMGKVTVGDKQVFDGTQIDDIECVAWTTAKGSDEVLEGSKISLRMAVLEGWYTKNGSKWQTMPEQMLRYRAAAFWIRIYAPELSFGMQTQEETQDILLADYEDVGEQVAKEKAADANKEEIGIDDEQTPEPQSAQDSQPQETVNKDTGEVLSLQPEQTMPNVAPDAPQEAEQPEGGRITARKINEAKKEPNF